MSIEDGVYFESLENIAKEFILSATKKVEIAMAWINFKIYIDCFKELLNNGINLSIIINDDHINNRYNGEIDELKRLGANIKRFKINGIMHQKYVIVDKNRVLFGSFNLSNNANTNNTENFVINSTTEIVQDFLDNFKFLKEIEPNDVKLLRKPEICDYCNEKIFYLCVISKEGDYQTKFDYYQVCGCDRQFLKNEFYDISVYNNFIALGDEYNDNKESILEYGMELTEDELKKLDSEYRNKIKQYFSKIRNHKNSIPVIHAIGMICWRTLPYPYKDDGEWYINILWKEYYTKEYIFDEYEL